MNVYQKLQTCRVELQKMNLKKSGKNTFAGFDYFELADFLPTVNELFAKYSLHSIFSIIDGVAKLSIIDSENPEEYEVFTSPIAEANLKGCTPIQSLGGVHTYMKRYLYVNALEITDGDVFDAVVGKPVKEEPKMTKREQTLVDILNGSKWTLANAQQTAFKTYGNADVNALSDEQFSELCEKWKGAVKQ